MNKRKERAYLDAARQASSLFPIGEILESEQPDFLLRTQTEIIGIEVTELCRQDPRTLAGKERLVLKRAQQRYARMPGAKPVDVSVAFSRHAEHLEGEALMKTLAEYVHGQKGGAIQETGEERKRTLAFRREYFVRGFLSIAIHEPMPDSAPSGRWHGSSGFETVVAGKDLIADCIKKKNEKLWDYRLVLTALCRSTRDFNFGYLELFVMELSTRDAPSSLPGSPNCAAISSGGIGVRE